MEDHTTRLESSATSVEHETSSQSSSQETSDSFHQRKVFWESVEATRAAAAAADGDSAPIPRPRLSISKPGDKSLETDTSSIRSDRQPDSLPFDSSFRSDLRQQDSLPYDDKLEDESFPMSESESENRTRDSISVSLKGEFVERQSTDDECDETGAAFYIGDKHTNVITKTSTDKRTDFAFDNAGYELSLDDDVSKKDFVHENIEIYDESTLAVTSESELAKHLVQQAVDDEKAEQQSVAKKIEEKSETERTEKKPPTTLDIEEPRRPPVVHSPIEKKIQMVERPQEIASIPVSKANVIEVISTTDSRAFRTQKEQELAVEQVFEEIKDSLDAVQEELIEVVKDGKLIKQSPSEFEFSFIPHEQSLPAHPEEQVTDQPLSIIKIQAPSEDGGAGSCSSADESTTNKLEVIARRETSVTPNRWSVTDVDSSSESPYQSAGDQSARSRPLSSDVENLLQTASDYDTALSQTPIPGSTATDYHSAISTLPTGSMKSFDSESSGNLASIEASEASETLVPSQMEECEADIIVNADEEELIHDDSEKSGSLEEKEPGILLDTEPLTGGALKRSQEMIFTETKTDSIEDLTRKDFRKDADEMQFGSLEDTRILGSSLEDGSLLSVSLSSASNLETVMENMEGGGDAVVGSLIGSYDSGKIYLSRSTDDAATTPTEIGPNEKIESMTMTSSLVGSDLNTQISTTVVTIEEPAKKRGHRRNESTSVLPANLLKSDEQPDSFDSSELDDEMIVHEDQPHSEPFIQAMHDKGSAGGPGGGGEESSDSDYDRYESEYSRSFRAPSVPRKKDTKKLDEGIQELIISRSRSPSFSMIETIVEDVHAESSEVEVPRRPSPNFTTNIPDIQVTDDEKELDDVSKLRQEIEERTAFSPIQYAQQVEYKMTEEEYHEMIDKKYRAQEIGRYGRYDDEYEDPNKPESPGSDASFEMLEQPDISDEFVIVEEVAKEAHEFDTEGKSVGIKKVKMEKKHDEDVERLLVKSAPERTDAATFVAHHEEVPFDFEESPPIDSDQGDAAHERGNGYPLEGSKRWVEMQLNDPNNLRYPYELQGGILEDIKEEDTDFEVGSSRISSFKDSFSSTPDYDSIARKLHSRENDNISMSSLQEFESLEQVISLENRKHQQSSQESLSNGSYPKRTPPKPGDDISLSSLKEFEALENASLEAVLLEIKAKEEAALLLSRSDESGRSDSSSGKKVTQGSPRVTTATVTTTTVVRSEPRVTQTTQVSMTTTSREVITKDDDDSSLNVMEVSTDSLDNGKKTSAHHASTDSLERNNTNADVMSSSIDSIEVKKGDTKSTSRSDSIEQGLNDVKKSESVDSIELQQAIARHQARIDRDSLEEAAIFEQQQHSTGRITRTTTETMQKEFSSDSITSQASNMAETLQTSTESMTSSTATNATYTNDMNSQMSGSMTSCDSTTLIDHPVTELGQSSSNYLLYDERELGQLHYDLTGSLRLTKLWNAKHY